MDSGGQATAHRLEQWRVHSVERHGFQFRDHHVGKSRDISWLMQAHESAVRSAAWSHNDDWLISGDHSGVLKYWQPNFNNVKVTQAHLSPLRDLAFSPNDSKYITGSDDTTVKLWDFSTGNEEATLTHGWEVRTVDWHPTKGLIVSGARDNSVKLWDPRTGKCLTTLHGHKNNISKCLFDPLSGNLLATAAREPIARIFDLRMMRDVLLLKGHDKEITTLTWHPIHRSLLSTAGGDGCLQHYLLDEPNLPEGSPPTKSPYDTADPANAPAQTIWPAHRLPHAHDYAIWSLDWHPLGHILASGSNDKITRFWSRPRPGETDCFHDRYHLGDAGAKAHGNYIGKTSRYAARDEEDDEDDEEALVDQKMPSRQPALPGLPGIGTLKDGTSTGGAQPVLPGMGGPLAAPPLPIPGMPFDPSRLPDPAELQKLFGGNMPPLPMPGQQFLPPPPGFNFPNGAPPPGFSLPVPGFVPPGGYPTSGTPPMPDGTPNSDSNRRRAPLPSQKESLQEEQRRGRYQRVR